MVKQDWKKIKKNDPKLLVKLGEIGIQLRNARKAKEKEAAELKAEQDDLEQFLLLTFGKADLRQVKTKAGTISLTEKDVPRVTDWEALHAHIKKTGEFDLLQRRAGERACQERWQAGHTVPGVEKFRDKRIKFGED